MAQPIIRLVIVHDMEIVRAGLESLLASCDDIVVVRKADRLAQLDASIFDELRVGVVLTDPYRPGGGGSDAIRRLLRSCPEVRVVTIAGSRGDHAVRSALHAGAAACVRITVEQPALVRAIRGAAEDRFVIPSDAWPSLVGVSSDMTVAATLTAREADVLALVAQGHTNKDIARALHLTEGTVSGYVSTILTKLGVANRTEATGVAIQHGLTTTPVVIKPALRL